jgi:predicted RNase H-like nuclease
LTLYPEAQTVQFAKRLKRNGFSMDVDPRTDKRRDGQWLFEVYTHSAIVELFDLPLIIKYKKGRVANKKRGLLELRQLMWEKLTVAEPPLLPTTIFRELTHTELSTVRGKALKNHEDALDAVLCTYMAFFYWYWGGEKNEKFGDLESGIIINPSTPH